MALNLQTLINDFADALAVVDRSGARHKNFRPGIGPFGEADAIRAALRQLKSAHHSRYEEAGIKRLPDLLIPGEWAIEFKIIRPFGDNGKPAEHWSENILHPYKGSTSSLGDCLKLLEAQLPEKKGVVIFGFEHAPAKVPLDPAIHAFELIAANVLSVRLTPRIETTRQPLIHPVHQVLRVFGYEAFAVSQ